MPGFGFKDQNAALIHDAAGKIQADFFDGGQPGFDRQHVVMSRG